MVELDPSYYWVPDLDPAIDDDLMEKWLSTVMNHAGLTRPRLLATMEKLVTHLSSGKRHIVLSGPPAAPTLTLADLQRTHIERQDEWCPDQKPDLSFRGNELGGECGEAQNVIKKLERERHGWRGSRDTVEHLGEELADVIHCAVLVAITAGIDIEQTVIAKFNATSEKNGVATRLATT